MERIDGPRQHGVEQKQLARLDLRVRDGGEREITAAVAREAGGGITRVARPADCGR